ncbi:MAG: sulfatase-like hydrolase/transferase, partial [Flavobacteriaceae bacterium]
FLFQSLHKKILKAYGLINRMYPFTIVLLGLFLATLTSIKKPVNENKTQYLVTQYLYGVWDSDAYGGTAEYPLLGKGVYSNGLTQHLQLMAQKPNIVVILVEGLGHDFVGKDKKYHMFAPFLTQLVDSSLYWKNFLGNSMEGHVALPSLVGSLPFGENGFTNAPNPVNRNTLFGLLKKNGYTTSFYYGGNSALNQYDRFLLEERVDYMLDRANFDSDYVEQPKDAAGISLGYPDGELFRKWAALERKSNKPRFEVFLTQSSKKPFSPPGIDVYIKKVGNLLKTLDLPKKDKRTIEKNEEVFASILYADAAIADLLREYAKKPGFRNTLFLITGTHNLGKFYSDNPLNAYRVHLLVAGDLVKSPKVIPTLASHLDVAQSLMGTLATSYAIQLPEESGWLGRGLVSRGVFDSIRQIPLIRANKTLMEYVNGHYFLYRRNRVRRLDAQMNMQFATEAAQERTRERYRQFKTLNKYVVRNNKLLPKPNAIFPLDDYQFSKEELVWIQSVFTGNDFDRAYGVARDLALDRDWDQALLLCRYILSKVPRHADTDILMGRIYGWDQKYGKSVEVLERVLHKYPTYQDAYSAMLDVCFWAGNTESGQKTLELIGERKLDTTALNGKMRRIFNMVMEEAKRKSETNTVGQL